MLLYPLSGSNDSSPINYHVYVVPLKQIASCLLHSLLLFLLLY